ncbi:MAG: hypothetical protein SCARUB_01285 [Candidatus Scalindua rubra]|uniref:Uncharacterized protein n=1 Tax=Candidatus Scalindua rubra TaxID=1872076 RepID=A0A1E3XD35_9BACT|nr:MAG: hypothetical protein SCARUB_01285 [Candidatus Scalindua rubra]
MKIKVEVGKLVSDGNFNNDSFKASVEFECNPGNYGELSSKFDNAFAIVNAKIRQQVANAITNKTPANFDDNDIPF